ncbi:MAG: thiamine phosphate synthase [Gemmatimonadaceae bacterium]
MPGTVPVIHAVTTDEIVARRDFLDRVAAVMWTLGPRGAVQLRAPRTSGAKVYALASALVGLQASSGAWLIVTDRVDVAVATGARGVQLTSRSIGVADALRVAPALAIGASAHSVAEARAAVEARATWVVVGQLRDERRRVAGSRVLRDVIAESRVPVVVIGGVMPEHVPALRGLGAYGVAAIRGIWEAERAEAGAAEYLRAYDGVAASP